MISRPSERLGRNHFRRAPSKRSKKKYNHINFFMKEKSDTSWPEITFLKFLDFGIDNDSVALIHKKDLIYGKDLFFLKSKIR